MGDAISVKFQRYVEEDKYHKSRSWHAEILRPSGVMIVRKVEWGIGDISQGHEGNGKRVRD